MPKFESPELTCCLTVYRGKRKLTVLRLSLCQKAMADIINRAAAYAAEDARRAISPPTLPAEPNKGA